MSDIVIKTENLTKTYGEMNAVDHVNMNVEKGKVYCLLGVNGAGKTSIMRMILSLTRPTSGKIFLFGQALKGYNSEIMSRVGSSVESPAFYPDLTAFDNLKYFARLRNEKNDDIVKAALDTVDLSSDSKKTFSKFSLGMKQRLSLANALMFNPDLLILDEPTNGLDPIGIAENRVLIKRIAKEDGKTILLSSHQLSEIEQMADTIGIIDNGKLLEEHSYSVLKKQEKSSIIIITDKTDEALAVLRERFAVKNFISGGNRIEISADEWDSSVINAVLNSSGIPVNEIFVQSKTLEEHFREITGGVEIA